MFGYLLLNFTQQIRREKNGQIWNTPLTESVNVSLLSLINLVFVFVFFWRGEGIEFTDLQGNKDLSI